MHNVMRRVCTGALVEYDHTVRERDAGPWVAMGGGDVGYEYNAARGAWQARLPARARVATSGALLDVRDVVGIGTVCPP